jgi:CNT family concentrative nucleoside transporter
MDNFDRYQGGLGVVAILAAVWLLSENRRAISLRTLMGGLVLQVGLGIALLRSAAGRSLLDGAAAWVNSILACAMKGAAFLFGEELTRADGPAGFVFAVQVLPAIIFVAALFAVLYHLGIMQRVVQLVAWRAYSARAVLKPSMPPRRSFSARLRHR